MTCIACGGAFPPNGELATIPDGRQVAFDLTHGRVWRICRQCGAWNLLGSEAAAHALEEIGPRYRSAPIRHIEGIGVAELVPGVELIRVDETVPGLSDDRFLFRRRREILAMSWGRYGVAALWWVWVMGHSAGWSLAGTFVNLVTFGGFALAVQALRPAYFRHRVRWGRFAAAVLLFITASVAGFLMHPGGVHLAYFALWTLALFTAPLLPVRAVIRKRLDAPPIRLDIEEVGDISLDWTADGAVTLHGLPARIVLRPGEDRGLLRELLEYFQHRQIPTTAGTARALELVRAAGGLPGILALLEGHRADQAGRMLLADLPAIYLAALDLALEEDSISASGDDGGLRRAAADAGMIAGEAERLDRGE